MMRQPKADEHGNMAHGDKSDGNWAACLQTELNAAYTSPVPFGSFPLPATPLVRVPGKRLAVLSRPQDVERRRESSRYGACECLAIGYECLCRGGEDSKGIGRRYTA